MTGYASVKINSIRYDIKGVNHRFLDIRLHVPSELVQWEGGVRSKVMEFVKRGSIDVFIHVGASQISKKLSFDTSRAHQFLESFKQLSKDLEIPYKEPHLGMLISHGEILKETQEVDANIKESDILGDLQEALVLFDEERRREGQVLGAEVRILFKDLERVRCNLEQLAEKIPENIKKKWDKKVSAWQSEMDPVRLAQEVLFHMDKSDVCEELTRLKEHIKVCEILLESSQSEGKKLDFYSQELFREMGTIGAKSSLVEVTQEVVQGKSIIEKIRQQVQNIE